MIPWLEDCLLNSDTFDATEISELVHNHSALWDTSFICSLQVQKGVASAQSDDTKGLKGGILDRTILNRQSLHPPIAHNIKIDHGFNCKPIGALLCATDMGWSDWSEWHTLYTDNSNKGKQVNDRQKWYIGDKDR